MKFLFDATVFEIPLTGVAKSALGLYEACYKMEPSLEMYGIYKKKLCAIFPEYIKTIKKDFFVNDKRWKEITYNELIDEKNPDFIHFHWNGGIPDNLKKIKKIITIHDVLPLEIPNYFSDETGMEKYISQTQKDIDRADLIFTVSSYSKRQLMSRFNLKKEPVVIYNSIYIKKSGEIKSKNPGKYFLYIGGYGSRKNLDKLLKVFLDLRNIGKIASRLIFTGQPSFISKDFVRMMKEGKKRGFVEEKGYVNDNELADLLSNATSLIYPSKLEGFGLPPLEAMFFNCPVITTNQTSLSEICGEAALFIEPDDEINFGNAIIEMEKNVKLRQSIIEKGKIQSSKFTWEKAAKTFLYEIKNLRLD